MALSPNRLLSSLTPEEFEAVAPHLHEQRHELGQVLYEHGDRIAQVYFPNSGIVSLLAVMGDGSAVETNVVGSEGMVGDSAEFGQTTQFGRALIQMSGTSQRINVGRFQDLVRRHEGLRVAVGRYNSGLLAEAQQNAACNAIHKLEARLAKWLLRCHDRSRDDDLPMTQEFLSYILGAQRTTVTEVARRLQFAGLVRYSRGRIRILDRVGLQRVSCECYRVVQDRLEELGLSSMSRPSRAGRHAPAIGIAPA